MPFRPTRTPLDVDGPTAACTDPALLPLVDLTFSGGVAARNRATADLYEQACRRCPVAHSCLEHAMANTEDGAWGGTTKRRRERHGAPPTTPDPPQEPR